MKQRDLKPETWYDLSDAANYLGVHFTTLRRWADTGKIPFIRTPGGRRRFSAQILEQFVQQMAAQPGGYSAALAVAQPQPFEERAIDQTRRNIHSLTQSDTWISRLSEAQRYHMKGTGQKLMVLLLQFNSRTEGGEAFLEEGKRISREYAQVCASIGMSLPETVRVFLFFRRSILNAIYETDHLEQEMDAESMRLFARTTDFMDGLLLDLIGSFPNDRISG
jgi:excisionase family DNA binding protein